MTLASHPTLTPLASCAVCLLDRDVARASILARQIRDLGHQVRVHADLQGLLEHLGDAGAAPPVAVMVVLDEADQSGAASALTASGRCGGEGVPLVVLSAHDDLAVRLAAYRAGATRFLRLPVTTMQWASLMEQLAASRSPRAYRVLLVDDDPLLLELHASMLHAAGMEVSTLSRPTQVLELVDSLRPDVVVLDVYMPEVEGPELAAVLRERVEQQGRDLPMLFLSSETDRARQLQALRLGGDDFLLKPVDAGHLVAAVMARARRARKNNELHQRLQFTLYEQERQQLALNQHAIVSIADARGDITYVNDKFCEISGYGHAELIGRNHRIVKSAEHPADFYGQMWRTITSGQVWQGEICNRRKDGGLYWVESTIVPFLDAAGLPYQYVSIRTDITQVKAAEAAARASEARLDYILKASPVVLYTCKAAPGFPPTYVSENVRELFGFDPRWCLREPGFWASRLHPEDAPRILAGLEGVLERGDHRHEYRFRLQDGSYRWIHDALRVTRDPRGRPLELVGYWADINDRKRAELALAEREQQLVQAQALANIGNWTADMRSGELYWSDEIYRIFGHAPGAIVPSVQAFMDAVHPDDRELVRASEQRAEHTGRHDVVHRIVRPDGTIRHVHELATAERDGDGRLVRLSGTVQDVTEQVQAEARLHETEARFAFAVEGAGDGIWDWNIATGEMPLSGRYESMLGYGQGELEPTMAAWVQSVHPDDLARARKDLADYLEGRSALYAPELRLRCKDGSYKWVLCRGTVVARDALGKPTRMIGIHSDISARKQAEAALVEAREIAERANQAKSEFLSSMSHELRTPMNAILGFSQLLEYDAALTDDNRDSVREILKAGKHLLQLINEVLDLAKVESGHVDLSLEPVELKSVAGECLSLLATQAAQRQVTFDSGCLEGVVVRADRMRLKQALLNLLSNAVKYNRPGGSAHLEARAVGADRWRVEVIDTGPGIAPRRLDELFQPFSRLGAEGGDIEGTGIGLTITRRLIEMMGGEMGVQSEVGVGSRFWFELPLETAADAHADPPSGLAGAAAPDAASPQDMQACTVLYIEDNPANIRLVAQILGSLPRVSLLTAHTPELGIGLATTRQPHLILLDINLPQMDGYQVLQVLRAHQGLAGVPVVAITANAMPRDIERGKAAGFDDYLVKPLDVVRFMATVKRLLPQGARA